MESTEGFRPQRTSVEEILAQAAESYRAGLNWCVAVAQSLQDKNAIPNFERETPKDELSYWMGYCDILESLIKEIPRLIKDNKNRQPQEMALSTVRLLELKARGTFRKNFQQRTERKHGGLKIENFSDLNKPETLEKLPPVMQGQIAAVNDYKAVIERFPESQETSMPESL